MTLNQGEVLQNPFDKILLANVHPPEWVNPEPAACYNMVVIGGGPVGCELAQTFARWSKWQRC